jgi:putative ABC transport system permease protein
MYTFIDELRFAVRSLSKSPAFVFVAVVTLALGIGANTAIFTIVNSVLLRPLPYQQPERLVNVWNDYGDSGQSLPAVSSPDFVDYRERAKRFEGFAAASGFSTSLTGDGQPEQIRAAAITSNFFPLLGVPVELGRQFQPGEDVPQGPALAVLSDRLWKRRFGGDARIVGKTIHLDSNPFLVVGVLAEGFELLTPAEAFQIDDADLWVPQRSNLRAAPRNLTGLTVIGRLKPGVSLAEAQAEMDGIAGQLRSEHLVHRTSGLRIRIVPYQKDVVKGAQPALLALLAAVGLVLLIACANVANLLLARGEGSWRETSIRAALGATRVRLLRHSLVESAILAVLGGAGGVLFAYWSLELLVLLRPQGLPRLYEIAISAGSLAFTGAISIATTLLFGCIPALQESGSDPAERLKGVRQTGTSAHSRVQNVLVSAEIALSVVLLIGTGLLLRSFVALSEVHPGFRADNALTFELSPSQQRFPGLAGVTEFYRQVERKLAGTPGVENVGSISKLPFTGSGPQTPYAWDEVTAAKWESISADWRWATPGWLDAIGGQLAEGRWFTEQDDAHHAPVAVVDELLAERAWPNDHAVGHRLLLSAFGPGDNRIWVQVVGVVRHIRSHDLRMEVREQVYQPLAQTGARRLSVVIRSRARREDLGAAALQVVRSLDPDVPLARERTLDEILGGARAQARFVLLMALVFGVLAVFLVIVGLYGVISYTTGQRRRETGIRMALGARPVQILGLVLGRGLRLGAWGLAAGVLAALVFTRFAERFLFGVQAADLPTYLGVVVLVLIVSLGSAYLPARRAMRTDPMASLRTE